MKYVTTNSVHTKYEIFIEFIYSIFRSQFVILTIFSVAKIRIGEGNWKMLDFFRLSLSISFNHCEMVQFWKLVVALDHFSTQNDTPKRREM